jgi:hypothetical protein
MPRPFVNYYFSFLAFLWGYVQVAALLHAYLTAFLSLYACALTTKQRSKRTSREFPDCEKLLQCDWIAIPL